MKDENGYTLFVWNDKQKLHEIRLEIKGSHPFFAEMMIIKNSDIKPNDYTKGKSIMISNYRNRPLKIESRKR